MLEPSPSDGAALAAARLPNVTAKAAIAAKTNVRMVESSVWPLVAVVLRDPVGGCSRLLPPSGFQQEFAMVACWRRNYRAGGGAALKHFRGRAVATESGLVVLFGPHRYATGQVHTLAKGRLSIVAARSLSRVASSPSANARIGRSRMALPTLCQRAVGCHTQRMGSDAMPVTMVELVRLGGAASSTDSSRGNRDFSRARISRRARCAPMQWC